MGGWKHDKSVSFCFPFPFLKETIIKKSSKKLTLQVHPGMSPQSASLPHTIPSLAPQTLYCVSSHGGNCLISLRLLDGLGGLYKTIKWKMGKGEGEGGREKNPPYSFKNVLFCRGCERKAD